MKRKREGKTISGDRGGKAPRLTSLLPSRRPAEITEDTEARGTGEPRTVFEEARRARGMPRSFLLVHHVCHKGAVPGCIITVLVIQLVSSANSGKMHGKIASPVDFTLGQNVSNRSSIYDSFVSGINPEFEGCYAPGFGVFLRSTRNDQTMCAILIAHCVHVALMRLDQLADVHALSSATGTTQECNEIIDTAAGCNPTTSRGLLLHIVNGTRKCNYAVRYLDLPASSSWFFFVPRRGALISSSRAVAELDDSGGVCRGYTQLSPRIEQRASKETEESYAISSLVKRGCKPFRVRRQRGFDPPLRVKPRFHKEKERE
ncbi:hypothetical protein ALC57_11232 [Trachymyrmex cornetzi]|uniref:Uncharacterized protein n=1 Tax=Trachymyrmex cornetzi TaxID=471704 RepID=A0A195DUF3_9HYME|nr:hypothetical protein ALC57_11232 [Trachymyrmex cornetzi]